MLPFRNRYRLCELFGIPIYLDFSLVILLLLFVTGGGSFASGILCALMLLVSITAHEFGHALTARAFGYETSDITLSLLGGCASLIALPRKASQEFLTAIAGPAVSFALCGLSFAALLFLPIQEPILGYSLTYLFYLNIGLGLFNLLPGFPLDGGRIFRSVMRRFMSRARATYVAMIVGRGVAVLIGLKGAYSIFNGGNWGFVTILIAWMIWKEGYREYLMARQEEDFSNWTQRDFDARVSPPPYEL